MARDSSGNHTLAKPAFVAGTTISETDVNADLSDISTELSDSLSRSGKGNMTAAFRTVDGTIGAPGIAFKDEIGSGFYRFGATDIRFAIGGADLLRVIPGGVISQSTFFANAISSHQVTDTNVTITGNPTDDADAVALILRSGSTLANATAKLLSMRNNNTEVLAIDKDGRFTRAGLFNFAQAAGISYGVEGYGDTGGVRGEGIATNSLGVYGKGRGNAAGVWAQGGATGHGVLAEATGSGAGLSATSNSGPGVAASGNATRAPLNLAPLAAPSTPSDGDIWVETGTNTLKVRINGVTKTVTLT